jgi:quercetin dioxygenase-like cupin family protein
LTGADLFERIFLLTVPAGAVHAVRNVGSGTGSVLATDVVEKGKPLLTLAE